MTRRLEDFDFEATCRDLGAGTAGASDEIQAASEIAGYALHYLFATGQLKDFRDYLRIAREPVLNTVSREHTFENMGQAEQWLLSQSRPEWGLIVKVAGRTYMVGKRAVTRSVLLPSFSPEELK